MLSVTLTIKSKLTFVCIMENSNKKNKSCKTDENMKGNVQNAIVAKDFLHKIMMN